VPLGSSTVSTIQQPVAGSGSTSAPSALAAHTGSSERMASSTVESSSVILNSSWAVRPSSSLALPGSLKPGSWIWIWLFAFRLMSGSVTPHLSTRLRMVFSACSTAFSRKFFRTSGRKANHTAPSGAPEGEDISTP
jgi:hypothetical protein